MSFTGAYVVSEAPLNLRDQEFAGSLEDGDDWTAAIARWSDRITTAHKGEGYAPPGLYITRGNFLPAINSTVRGAGKGATVFKLADNAPPLAGIPWEHKVIFANSLPSVGYNHMTLENLTLDGNIQNNQEHEWIHGLETFGGQTLRIRNVESRNVRGDGLCIGFHSSTFPTGNTDVLIEDITLSEVGQDMGPYNARQGIAVIQGRDVTVRRVHADKCYAYIVDIEPDNSAESIQTVTVEEVYGYDCAAGVAVTHQPGGLGQEVRVKGLHMRGGPTVTLSRLLLIDRMTRFLCQDISCDVATFVAALLISNSSYGRVRDVDSMGAGKFAPAYGIELASTTDTIVSGANMRNVAAGSQQIAGVGESGTSDRNTVCDNPVLEGTAIAPATNRPKVFLLGARSRAYRNGPDPDPFCVVSRSSNQTGIINGTYAAIAWDLDVSDPAGMHDPVTNNNRVNILETGWYRISVDLRWSASGGTYREINVQNSAGTPIFVDQRGGNTMHGTSSHRLYLEKGDWIQVFVRQDTGGTISLVFDPPYSPRLSVEFLGL